MAKKTKIITPHEGFQDKFVRTNVDVCFAGGVLNCGKAQPLDSKVLTPNGWVKMGDLKVGSMISDTQSRTQIVENIFEQGIRDCYEVTFDDGSKVRCCDEHLWNVWDKSKQCYDVVELKYIIDDKKRYSLDLTQPVVFNPDKSLPIHPYLLGALLGDAYLGDSQTSVKIFTDREIIDRAYGLCPFDFLWKQYAFRMPFALISDSGIRKALKELDLYGKRSQDKFIPYEYLYTSIENRVELLRGLFDTDGYNDERSYRVEYSTVSEQLAKDVTFLVKSLGGKVSISTKIGSYKDKNGNKISCKKVYRLSCRLANKNYYFALSRKKKNNLKQGRRLCLNFKDIIYCGKEEMRCIKVSNSNHLYITDDFVVTHNTTGAVLMCAQPSLDPNFRGVFLRNNLGDIRSGGGILDEFKSMYRGGVNVVESGEPRVEFPSGARIDVTHIADQSREKVRQRFKGRQYDLIYFDEMTGFSFECFCEVCTRNRGTGKWTGKIRGTTNPERNHWLREFLDWYIGIDGFIREDRNGVVRYFYMSGETVRDVVWGDSKEEVYQKCKIQIDRQLARINGKTGNATYKDLIRSFTFYLGKMTENVSSIGNNSGYVGAVAMSGGRNAEQLLEGNWNVSPNEALDAPIPQDMANQVFMNDDKRNGDRWVTCDLADTGTDNFLAIAWDGFHIIDILILGRTTPRQNAERLQIFAAEHDVADSHIIYDAIRGTYINDYIPEAVPYVSYRAPMGMYGRLAQKLKDECYLRLVETIKRGDLSIEESVALRTYEHQNLKDRITIQNEFMEECSVVRFKDVASGKKTLLTKKEMNQKLGKGRSMDLLDPMAMRMLPVLEFAYGEELEKTTNLNDTHDDDYDDWGCRRGGSIYDDSFWC